MPLTPVDDPSYQAGYQQGLVDASVGIRPLVSPQRRYILAAGTFAAGIGSAAIGVMLFSKEHRKLGGVLAFSAALLGAVFGAAHVLVDERPETPQLRLRP